MACDCTQSICVPKHVHQLARHAGLPSPPPPCRERRGRRRQAIRLYLRSMIDLSTTLYSIDRTYRGGSDSSAQIRRRLRYGSSACWTDAEDALQYRTPVRAYATVHVAWSSRRCARAHPAARAANAPRSTVPPRENVSVQGIARSSCVHSESIGSGNQACCATIAAGRHAAHAEGRPPHWPQRLPLRRSLPRTTPVLNSSYRTVWSAS